MNSAAEYTPPTVWTRDNANGGRFANINRPISGATHEKDLPEGRHPLQMDVLDRRLAESPYLAGDDYTIADMAMWPWYGALAKGQLYEAGEFLQVQTYTNVLRWTDQIATRPAVRRGRRVNRTWGQPDSQLPERHDARDFDKEKQR